MMRIIRYPHILLVALVLANLLAAAFIFDDFGESWDEPNIYLYARESQGAYMARLRGEPLSDSHLGPFNLRNYGPFYFVLSDLFSRAASIVFPQVNQVDFWHLAYFLSFMLAIVCMYALCLRWASRTAALAAVLVFNAQPLLWGHAFINPKDIPFMAFFLLSIVLGLRAVDRLGRPGTSAWIAAALAGLALGAATAIRISAPLAGAIVGAAFLLKAGRRALGPLALYIACAATVTLIAWPYLWDAPLRNLLAVFIEMSNFPMDIGVRFNGEQYSSLLLPADYLPRLLLFQLTMPALLLMAAGGVVAMTQMAKKKLPQANLLGLMVAWFIAPILLIVLSQPTQYDNFRQFLFLLPPLFIFIALAWDELAARTRPVVFGAMLAMAVLPSLVAIRDLHPYEYAFYNLLAGDRATLASRYEADYWVTSYRAAIEYVNETAEEGARIYIWGDGGPTSFLEHFGRPDLTLDPRPGLHAYDYAILTTRFDVDQEFFGQAPVVFQVARHGSTYVVVKDLR